MANVFVNLPVPVAPGLGPAVDVSGISPQKSLVLEGAGGALPVDSGSDGVLILECSQDGVNFAPYKRLDLLKDPHEPPFLVVCSYMRIRRAAGFGGSAILGISGEATSSNAFGLLVVPNQDAGPATDVSSMGVRKTVIVIGQYAGALAIEGSQNGGLTYDPVLTCPSQGSGVYYFSGVYSHMRVRRLGGVTGGSLPIVTVGGHPGGGGAAGANSCLLRFGGNHYSNEESPNPYPSYHGDAITDWSNVPWYYALPAGGTASGLRIDVSYNDCPRSTDFTLMNSAVTTTQAVTVGAGLTGTFITSGASVVYAAAELMTLRAQTANHLRASDVYFTAWVLYTF